MPIQTDDLDARILAARARIAAWRAQIQAERLELEAAVRRQQFWAQVDAKRFETRVLRFQERAQG